MSRPVPPAASRPLAAYLGDGVYANFDGFAVQLTSENGVEILDEIYLEPEVIRSLVRYAVKHNINTTP